MITAEERMNHIGSRVREAKRLLSLERRAGTRLPWLSECLCTLDSKHFRPDGEKQDLPYGKRVADLEFATFAINESTRIARGYLDAVDTARRTRIALESLRDQLANRDAEIDTLSGQVSWLRDACLTWSGC